VISLWGVLLPTSCQVAPIDHTCTYVCGYTLLEFWVHRHPAVSCNLPPVFLRVLAFRVVSLTGIYT